ncbi:glycosyltransferase family 2 protein [Legionella jordanis]|uniref:Glycosyltransferase n=1 Tax=Legionella jordanis TaxID=456 RepID=A0A0W0VGH4_9GAMM|nr:glycosyltransferase family 2 protein [Legionella jordanis]KTD18973.1 glycosyltransferase [Legionella jordanis]RMX05465.1 glycosyltransferase family 2 protein [Legionella jordanis]RMX19150.1 glycosyltransferase family 2 protein [Legionella jordanis]VEH13074.1 glycosyltransferase [Legionella jordanis]HAT8714116.1 glycosyltransferase [Legionella jordanis]
MTEKVKVLVIVPAYNEEDSLPSLLSEIKQLGYDAVVIDDCSRDATAQVASKCGFPVLSLAANLGIGGAVQTGFKYALSHGYDIVVQVDGDGQHNPVWIESLIDPIIKGEADCVIGSRYVRENPDKDYKTPFARRMGMYFSQSILYLASGIHVTDTTSGLRALSRRAFEYFAKYYPVDHPEAEALFMLHRKGFRIAEIPVKMRGRVHGQSLFNFAKASLYPIRVLIGFTGLLLKRRDS